MKIEKIAMTQCSNGSHLRAAKNSVHTLRSVLNGRERSFPLTHVHPDRFTDLCTAADLIGQRGGLTASSLERTTSLVQLAVSGLSDSERAACRGREVAAHLLRLALSAVPLDALPPGCMPALEVRAYGEQRVLVSFYVEHAEAFAVVEPAARAIAPEVARLLGASVAPHIAIGTAERRRVRVSARVALDTLQQGMGQPRGSAAHARDTGREREALRQVLARFAQAVDAPDLAFEHNARALSGLAAAAAIFGAATDHLQAEGQTHAARWGGCEPLVRWQRVDGDLVGELEVPVALQRVRGIVNAAAVEAACDIAAITCTRDLELSCASAGLLASIAGLCADLRTAQVPLRAHGAATPRVRDAQARASSLPGT
jgi:hydroxymethylglutaryl-CoA reductase